MEEIIYRRGDPCLDGYFCIKKSHLILGARRLGPSEIILDAMTCSFSPLPCNKTLGETLLTQLNLTKKSLSAGDEMYCDIKSGKYSSLLISMAESYDEFNASYLGFTVWTKDDEKIPYIMGVPVSERFALYENTRPIPKSISCRDFGIEFKRFLNDFVV